MRSVSFVRRALQQRAVGALSRTLLVNQQRCGLALMANNSRNAVGAMATTDTASSGHALMSKRVFASSTQFGNEEEENEYFMATEDDDMYVQYPLPAAKVAQRAPRFTAKALVNGKFEDVSLDQFHGKYVVLFFYPKDFTYVCPTEITAFNDRAEEFAALNTQLLAISVDSVECHLAWTKLPRNKGGLGPMQIPILSDITKVISAKYGVLSEDAGCAFRGLFVIDPKGVLQQMTINNNPVGRNVDETLRLIKAFQFVEEHGEVCPANWQPGARTMKAHPTDSQQYFSSLQEVVDDEDESPLTFVKNKTQFDAIIKAGKPVVAQFSAPWCGKCEKILPFVEELASQHTDVEFLKLDVDLQEIEALKDQMHVEALPAFYFFKNGKQVLKPVTGYKKTPLKEAIKQLQ